MSTLLPESALKQRKSALKAEKEGRFRKYRNKEGKMVKVKIKAIPLAELQARWKKKKEHLEKLASNIRSIRYNLTRDLKSEDEKTRLTALVISLMDCTAERVGNQDSAESGHFGVTGFQKKHVTVIGNKIHLSYRGKSGVDHEKSFSDKLIAQTLKRAIKDSPGKFVFTTSDGFRIHADKVNRYLKEYHVTAKDIRGYCANSYVIEKLKNEEIPVAIGVKATRDLNLKPETLNKEQAEKKRKSIFNKAVKWTAKKVGHGTATLKNHYLMPEVGIAYIQRGEIINLIDFYSNGGHASATSSPFGGGAKEEVSKPKHICPCTRPVGFKKKNKVKRFSKGGKTSNIQPPTSALLAPNGNPSNLNATQYALVRTPEFKKWFGDWENDKQNSSKALDENGEPLVVYQGFNQEFYVHDRKKIGKDKHLLSYLGFHFTPNKKMAESLFSKFSWKSRSFFLNIRNMVTDNESNIVKDALLSSKAIISDKVYFDKFFEMPYFDINKKSWAHELATDTYSKNPLIPQKLISKRYFKKMTQRGIDGIKYLNEIEWADEKRYDYIVFYPNQIKLADGSNTTFDAGSDDIRFEEGGKTSTSLAPNGKPSNLNAKQYALVRTPEFKKWFGDWENDKKNSSKVVDENGEPKAVYHGSINKFCEFNKSLIGKKTYNECGGFYFTDNYNTAYSYSFDENDEKYNENVVVAFLNLRNPKVVDYKDERWLQSEEKGSGLNKLAKIILDNGNYDGIIAKNIVDPYTTLFREDIDYKGTTYVVFEPNQIKLADGSNTTFDTGSDDIRFEEGGKTSTSLAPNGKPSNLNAIQYALVRTPEFKAWFGDWENDKKNSSKVVDENGEPKVVYHSTNAEFHTFNIKRSSNTYGAYFSANKESTRTYGKITKSYFLNVRNPEIPKVWNLSLIEKYLYEKLLSDKKDGAFWLRKKYNLDEKELYEIVVFNSNQIKLADGTNTTFDAGSDDIRFEEGGHIGDAPMTNDQMTNDISIERKISYLYSKLWSHNNNLVAYAQHISKMLLAGHHFKSKLEHEKIAKTYGIQHADIAKEWAEYAVVLTARKIVEENKGNTKQTFDKLTDLYGRQPSLTHRTSTTITKQQYSTPAPIAYLMSYWATTRLPISLEKGAEGEAPEGLFFEPTAGTGLLTIATAPEHWVVNEIDKTRLDILRLQGFTSVLNQDATRSIKFLRALSAIDSANGPQHETLKLFNSIVANPPFGNTHEIKYGNFTLTGLEQLISARALEYMKDDGKCALIIGGNTEYDERGRIKSKKDLVFFNYLAQHYNLVDVINISPELFRKQGAVYPTRIILISGTQSNSNTYYPLANFKADNTTKFSTKAVDNLPTLYSRILGE